MLVVDPDAHMLVTSGIQVKNSTLISPMRAPPTPPSQILKLLLLCALRQTIVLSHTYTCRVSGWLTADISGYQALFLENPWDADCLYVMRVSPSTLFYFILVWLVFIFRQQHANNPELVKGINWSFSSKTSNTSLRVHLECIHKTEYLELCKANGWSVMLPKTRKLALVRGGSEGGQSGIGPPCPAFSQSQFLQSLVDFIISDDQVCTTTLLKNCILNYIIFSQFMSWHVVNSAICFSCCGMTCRRRTFRIAQNFVRPSSLHGSQGFSPWNVISP